MSNGVPETFEFDTTLRRSFLGIESVRLTGCEMAFPSSARLG
jgi:hypothetical protein